MNKESLRRVAYSLEPRNKGFVPGEEGQPVENYKGYFHEWTREPCHDPHDNTSYIKTVAIIEREDGSLITIPHEWFNFQD